MKLWLQLGRISNLPTVLTNIAAGLALGFALGGWPAVNGCQHLTAVALVWLSVGGIFAYVGGCTLNDAFDAEWDRQHRPERPIPAGLVSRRSVALVGAGELLFGGGGLWLGRAAPELVVSLIVVILLYDWCHKRTAWAVVPMALCRVALGACAFSAALPASASLGSGLGSARLLLWLGALGGHIIILTAAARGEATRRSRGQTFSGGLLLAIQLGFLFLGSLVAAVGSGWMPLIAAFVYVVTCIWGLKPLSQGQIGQAVTVWLASICLLDHVVITSVFGGVGLISLVLSYLLTRQWQRRIAAT